ncbi:MAG: serine hydrolase [Verrucomicrobiae bacterium]|nr:serine hydrolase [Verrucomicrobiae bacterium]
MSLTFPCLPGPQYLSPPGHRVRRQGSKGMVLLAVLAGLAGCAPRQTGPDQYPNANQLVTDWKDTQWMGMPAGVDVVVSNYLARSGAPPGVAVGIMENNAIRHLKGYGLADRERNHPFTHATMSMVGSVSKTLTALGLLRMVEMGLVGLDDPIQEHLGVPTAWSGITPRQLLSHTSGLQREARMSAALSTSESLSTHLFPWLQPPSAQLGIHPSLVIHSYAGTPVIGFETGETARYSNAGYLVLGALIETVAGSSVASLGVPHSRYESFIWRYVGYYGGRLSDPNQMISPGLNPPWRAEDIPWLAGGYTWNEATSNYVPATYDSLAGGPAGWEGPAGGWAMTIGDMVRLMVALQNNSIVSSASRTQMLTEHGAQGSLRFGLGMLLGTKLGLPVYLHDGAYPGFKARFTVWSSRNFGVALLANETGADMNQLTDDVARVFLGSGGIGSGAVSPAALAPPSVSGTDDDPGLGLDIESGIGPMPALTDAQRRARWEELNQLERQQAQARSSEALIQRRIEAAGCPDPFEEPFPGLPQSRAQASAGMALLVFLVAECQDQAASPSEAAGCVNRVLTDRGRDDALPCAMAALSEDIRRGLVSYWAFEEVGERAPDWVSGNHLVAVGAPQTVPGRRGNAVGLSGAGQYLRIDHDADPAATGLPVFGAESYTIAMWVKGPPQTGKYLFSHGSSTGNNPLLILQTGQVAANQDRFDVIVRNSAGTTPVNHRVSTGVVFDDTWRHVAWVDDRGQARLYIDGEPDPTDFAYTRSGSFPFDRTAVGTLVRAMVAEGAVFQGALDELTLWERALSQAEVIEVMKEGIPGPPGFAPTLVTQPADVTAAVGDTVSFSVVAIGARPFNYQWTRNGQPVEGATGATYALEDLALADAGATFSVAISNPHGLSVSRAARLNMPQALPPTVFFGEDVSPHPVGGPNVVPRPATLPESSAAAHAFESALEAPQKETFELFQDGDTPGTLVFGDVLATLSGPREVVAVSDPGATFNGVFPISGAKALLLPGGHAGHWAIDLSEPGTAVGFYATDLGESAGLQITLVTPDGWRTQIDVPVTRPQGSGGAFFFGVIDRNHPFVRVELERLGIQADGFGLDDLSLSPVAGTPGTVRLAVRRFGAGEVELSWASTPNRTYRIEYREAVAAGPWLPLGPFVGNAGTTTALDRIPAGTNTRFYRLVIPVAVAPR